MNQYGKGTACVQAGCNVVIADGRRRDVLVRVLFNEADWSIPALGEGPFYPWETLRRYLLSVIN